MYSEFKAHVLSPLEWNNKGRKTNKVNNKDTNFTSVDIVPVSFNFTLNRYYPRDTIRIQSKHLQWSILQKYLMAKSSINYHFSTLIMRKSREICADDIEFLGNFRRLGWTPSYVLRYLSVYEFPGFSLSSEFEMSTEKHFATFPLRFCNYLVIWTASEAAVLIYVKDKMGSITSVSTVASRQLNSLLKHKHHQKIKDDQIVCRTPVSHCSSLFTVFNLF